MNNKAFTLVELIAVIALIALVLIVTTTAIGKTIEKQRQETFKDSINGIVKSAEMYSIDLSDDSLTNGYYVFSYDNKTLKFNDTVIKTDSSLEDSKGYIYVTPNGSGYAKMYKKDKYCFNSLTNHDGDLKLNIAETDCLK